MARRSIICYKGPYIAAWLIGEEGSLWFLLSDRRTTNYPDVHVLRIDGGLGSYIALKCAHRNLHDKSDHRSLQPLAVAYKEDKSTGRNMAVHDRAFSLIEEGNSLLQDKEASLDAIECFLKASDILRQLSADDERVKKLYISQADVYKLKSREVFIGHIQGEEVLSPEQSEKRSELFAVLFNDGYGVVTKQEMTPVTREETRAPMSLEERMAALSSSIGETPAKYTAASKDEELRARLDSLRNKPSGSEKERIAHVKDGLVRMGIKTGVDSKSIMDSEPLSTEDEVDLIVAQAHDEAALDEGHKRRGLSSYQSDDDNDNGDDQELAQILREQGIADGYMNESEDSLSLQPEEEEVSVSATNKLLEAHSASDQPSGLKSMISNAQSILLEASTQLDETNDKDRVKALLIDAKAAVEESVNEVEAAK